MTPEQLSGLFGGIGQVGAAALPYVLSEDEIGQLRQLGSQSEQRAQEIAKASAQAAQFQPYSVRFGTSTTQVGPEGITSMLAEPLANIQGGLIGQTQQLMGQQAPTAESLYQQTQAMRQPEIDRQRLELENRLFSQGRLGTQTAMYGGTPEALAMEKALAEQQSADLLAAQQLAPQLEQARIQNIGGLLGTAFIPQQQSLAAIQPSLDMARIQQAARQGEAEALYRGGIAGLEAQAAAGTAAANVEAARTQALANALSGMFAKPDYAGGTSSFQDVIGNILGSSSNTSSSAAPFSYNPSTEAMLYDQAYPLSNDEFFNTYGYFRGEA